MSHAEAEAVVRSLRSRALTPLEEARAILWLLEFDPDLTQGELAARIGRSQSFVSKRLTAYQPIEGEEYGSLACRLCRRRIARCWQCGSAECQLAACGPCSQRVHRPREAGGW